MPRMQRTGQRPCADVSALRRAGHRHHQAAAKGGVKVFGCKNHSRIPFCHLCLGWHSSHFQSGFGTAPKLAATPSMMDEDSFTGLTHEIMSQGYDEETASHYAVLIGDTPCVDEAGNIVVLDGEKEIARLKPLKMFEAE
jgi:hypothetical protein